MVKEVPFPMTQEVKELRKKLDALLDQWNVATPAERPRLVLEKIKLEESLEAAERRALAGNPS